MIHKDMFTGEDVYTAPVVKGKRGRKATKPRGHIMPPGTGPKGETCKTCAHLYRKACSKTYLKCGLNKPRWTGGRGSDVMARDPACKKWEKIVD